MEGWDVGVLGEGEDVGESSGVDGRGEQDEGVGFEGVCGAGEEGVERLLLR